MFNITKLISAAAFGSIILGSSLTPAGALQLREGAAAGSLDDGRGVSAYTDDGHGAAAQEASVLSAKEVRHIKWCAASYRLRYDPVSDTYSRGGMNFQCLSPR